MLNRCVPIPALLAAVALIVSACESRQVAQPYERQVRQPIVNGTRDSQTLTLTEGEKLAIGWLHEAGQPSSNFCTGTLISPNVVATASHCTQWQRASDIGFGVGLRPSDPDATFAVSEIHEHNSVDAALLVLAEDATSVVPSLTPIAANREALSSADEGVAVDAAGYGETMTSSRDGRWFARVYIDTVYDDQVQVDGRGEQGICWGDSGGPIIWENDSGDPVVLGVESWGDPTCVDNDYLTRLDKLTGWIDPIVGDYTPTDSCDGLDYLGRCNGDVAEWCEGETFKSVDCSDEGLECGWVDDETGYYCVETSVCTPVDEQGWCDGDTLVTCEDGSVVRVDCTSSGMSCELDAGSAACVNGTPVADPQSDAGADLAVDDGGGQDVRVEADSGSRRGKSTIGCGCASLHRPGTPVGAPALLGLLALTLIARRRRHSIPRLLWRTPSRQQRVQDAD